MKKKIWIVAALYLLIAACTGNSDSMMNSVEVQEVIQVSDYTYLYVKEKKKTYWMAVPSMEVNVGRHYQYQGGLAMQDFYSKDLDRTFENVLFVESLVPEEGSGKPGGQELTPGSKVTQERSEVNIESLEGSISIAEIYANPGAYSGKKIRVKGEVTKFNPAIMERNWVHIQDGTDHQGQFDLTATSTERFEVGSVVVLEGVLATDLDFGYGYTYEVLLEKATVVP